MLVALKSSDGRGETGQFLAEGIRVLEEALRFNVPPLRLLIDPQRLTDRAIRLIKLFESRRVPLLGVSSKQLEKLSDTQEPQSLIGVFRLPSQPEIRTFLSPNEAARILWTVGVSDPGNLGTLIRSAAAFGFKTVFCSHQTADPFSPKVVRATAGSLFAVRVVSVPHEAIIAAVKSVRVNVLAAVLPGRPSEELLAELPRPLAAPLVLAIGSEAGGLPADVLEFASGSIRISHSPAVESLNAAVAGSILMYQIDQHYVQQACR